MPPLRCAINLLKRSTTSRTAMIWPYGRIVGLPAKNTLTPNDALAIEVAYRALLEHHSRFPANRDFCREKFDHLTV
jgi:hypothetical protein